MCAYYRGASRVIMIDNVPFRLEFSQQKVPGVETIDFGQHKDVYKRLRELVPEGPHVSIEAVGFHYTKSLSSSIEMAVGLQTDPSDMINEMIVSTRKVGHTGFIHAALFLLCFLSECPHSSVHACNFPFLILCMIVIFYGQSAAPELMLFVGGMLVALWQEACSSWSAVSFLLDII